MFSIELIFFEFIYIYSHEPAQIIITYNIPYNNIDQSNSENYRLTKNRNTSNNNIKKSRNIIQTNAGEKDIANTNDKLEIKSESNHTSEIDVDDENDIKIFKKINF